MTLKGHSRGSDIASIINYFKFLMQNRSYFQAKLEILVMHGVEISFTPQELEQISKNNVENPTENSN